MWQTSRTVLRTAWQWSACTSLTQSWQALENMLWVCFSLSLRALLPNGVTVHQQTSASLKSWTRCQGLSGVTSVPPAGAYMGRPPSWLQVPLASLVSTSTVANTAPNSMATMSRWSQSTWAWEYRLCPRPMMWLTAQVGCAWICQCEDGVSGPLEAHQQFPDTRTITREPGVGGVLNLELSLAVHLGCPQLSLGVISKGLKTSLGTLPPGHTCVQSVMGS